MSDTPIRKRKRQPQSVNKPIRKRTRNTNRPFRKRTRRDLNKAFRSRVRNNASSSRHTDTDEQTNEGTGEGVNSIIKYTDLLENDIEVSADNGLFDKIEIHAEHGNVLGSRSEVDLFRRYLGAPPTDDR